MPRLLTTGFVFGWLAVPVLAQPNVVVPPPAPGATPTPSSLGTPNPATQAPSWPKEIGGKDLNTWIGELSSPDPSVRDAALKVIPLFGPDAREPALKPLLQALRQERDPGVRLNVIDLIGTIGAKNPEEAREIAKSLALALSNSSLGGPSRLRLVQALANYGPNASDALPAVLSTVTDPSWETRRAVAFSLGRLAFATDPKKGPSANALKALSGNLLKDDSVAVRLESVQSLVMLGPPGFRDPTEYAKVIKPYLDNVLARQKVEKDKAVLIWLQVLVMRYDGTQLNDANVGKLADYLQQTEPSVRYHALSALAMLGDKAQPVVPRIAVGLGYQEPEMVLATIGTLASLGEIARAALPELERLKANTKEEALKRAATEAVEIISGRKKPDPNAPPPAPPPAPGQPPKM